MSVCLFFISYSTLAEFGDYDPLQHGQDYLDGLVFAPEQVRSCTVFHYEASEVIFEFPEQNRTKLSCSKTVWLDKEKLITRLHQACRIATY